MFKNTFLLLGMAFFMAFQSISQNKFDQKYEPKSNPADIQFKWKLPNKKSDGKSNINSTAPAKFIQDQLILSHSDGGSSILESFSKSPKQHTFWISFEPSSKIKSLKSRKDQMSAVLGEFKEALNIETDVLEHVLIESHLDEYGEEHASYQQKHKGLKVRNGIVKGHTKYGTLNRLNGVVYPISKELSTEPRRSSQEAVQLARKSFPKIQNISAELKHLIGGEQEKLELIVLFDETKQQSFLAYEISIYPDLKSHYFVFVDAHTGAILQKLKDSCKFYSDHANKSVSEFSGPQVATEPDLAGLNVQINVYEQGGTYYLLNLNEKMFNAAKSKLPNEPVGGIITFSAKNTSPVNDNFKIDHIVSSDNKWNNPNAVSAHVNSSISFKYFDEKFSRVSFDSKGSTIYSIINVAEDDGSKMDNAFWNGFAMFYGDGDVAFNRPLAASKDVAAHEMSHGVIQHTANLEYQNESGALNESFADIFAVMIDRDDWGLGEDVVNKSIFKTGFLRNLQNPNNGGSSLNDEGWQPKTVSQQYFGSEDDGGVHINSGIPNYAFYLFASNASVGKDRAELIYYKALRDYLTASSRFVDLRNAVTEAIKDIHGENAAILKAKDDAFNAVGIVATTTTPEVPLEYDPNSGEDYVLWYSDPSKSLVLRKVLQEIDNVISTKGMINKPSVSDDGSTILYIAANKKMYAILIDWDKQTVKEELVDEQIPWRNVAISKDGSKLAAVSGDLDVEDFDNQILVADLVGGSSKWFELYNPTTVQGVKTGDVQFADALEWDHSSQYVMYDAANQIKSFFNNPIEYWDIGFLKAWNNTTNKLWDGQVFKLFPSLPENISVGNPSFSKNNPDIMAFDLLDDTQAETEYFIMGLNLETGEQGVIYENNTVGYPSYGTRDDIIIFNFQGASNEIVAITELKTDKITGTKEAFIYVDNGTWGVWFNNGLRELSTSVADEFHAESIVIEPNPVFETLQLRLKDIHCSNCPMQIYDVSGKMMLQSKLVSDVSNISISGWPAGIYTVKVISPDGIRVNRFVKLSD